MANTYQMKISRMTVDKLGVKLYDRVSAVMAELIANSYDADASEVTIFAPMDEMLAEKKKGEIQDKGLVIEISDNGIGMTPEEVNSFYLVVGAERRSDPKRGDVSKKYKRRVMGRKGVGKLAPFGICQQIEVITSGGKEVKGKDENGSEATGYLTAHLILDRTKILKPTDDDYFPIVGKLDGIVRPNSGTILKLRKFDHRRVPKIEEFDRQMAQRFGIATTSWKIELKNSLKPEEKVNVGEFSIDVMEDSKVEFQGTGIDGNLTFALDHKGKKIGDLTSGFVFENKIYPITGWIAYSKKPYKDDLMAGVRIYCRGKIAAQTNIFNMKAGFTGEYDIRSYLVGSLNADWLDEEDDLIRTDRQDILWSQPLGHELEAWGQTLIKKIGSLTKEPIRKAAWDQFEKTAKITEMLEKEFPGDAQAEMREKSLDFAKMLVKTVRSEELQDPEVVENLVQLSLLMGPHVTLDEKLREAAESGDSSLAVITEILKTARIAELAGFGKIADDRIRVIQKIQELKDDPETLESALQDLIENAPWLINPQWAPITANQTFTTFVDEFKKYYKKETGEDLNVTVDGKSLKRADFIMSNQENQIQIIEIKRPEHKLENSEMDRIQKYVNLIKKFVNQPGNQEFKSAYGEFKVTLVCDGVTLSGVHEEAFERLKENGKLDHISWRAFLLRTKKMHEAFLNEAERQKRIAAKK